jgi:hypothetical protein
MFALAATAFSTTVPPPSARYLVSRYVRDERT